VEVLFYPTLADYRSTTVFLRFPGFAACGCGKGSTLMKTSMQHWRNDTDGENLST